LPGENALFQSTNIGYFFGVRGFCAEIMTGCKFFCRKLWGGNFFYLSESFEPIKLEVYEKVAFIGGCGILHNRFAGPEF
jgi:hypothetical protein